MTYQKNEDEDEEDDEEGYWWRTEADLEKTLATSFHVFVLFKFVAL